MIDLGNLMPAPWRTGSLGTCVVNDAGAVAEMTGVVFHETKETTAEFIALARNAFDVMMRRGWGVRLADSCPIAGKVVLQWQAIETRPGSVAGVNSMIWADDPFTALVEADAYMTNVEKRCIEAST